MHWSHRRSAVLAVLVVATAGLVSACTPQAPPQAAAPKQDPVARGRYLTTIMSCNDCHTPGYFYGMPDTTRRLSGSDVGWVGPWGVVHARNLTPDSTGIGAWSAEEIVATLRTGSTPDHAQLAPIMPWGNYGDLTDEDAYAIAAYLKSLPPIHHVNLPRIPPGEPATGANVPFPPPPAWDVPVGAAPAGH